MQINRAAFDRIAGAKFNAETTVTLLGLMAAQADIVGAPGGTINFDYHQPGDPIEPGDLIPVLTFTLRPYHLAELQEYETTLPPGSPLSTGSNGEPGAPPDPSPGSPGDNNTEPADGG